MRLEDALYFSPNFRFDQLDLTNTDLLIAAFEDRVSGFYFKPAFSLSEDAFSFAKGALTLASIDFIGGYFYDTKPSRRIKEFCAELRSVRVEAPDRVELICKTINDSFRNGLIHNGMIKKLGQFAPDIDYLIEIRDNYSIINPTILLNETQELFSQKIDALKSSKNDRFHFKKQFKESFEAEINSLAG